MNANIARKLNVLLVAPLPPPPGGISTWTTQMLAEGSKYDSVELRCVDTAVRWRTATSEAAIYGPLLRMVGGSLQACRDALRMTRAIRRERPDVVHITTSGGLATPKDILLLWLAKRLGVPSIIHYRMGRLPGIIASNGRLWKLTRTAMRLASLIMPLGNRAEQCVQAALPDAQVLSIPNPIELSVVDAILADHAARDTLPSTPLHIMFCGWVIPAKGTRQLVEACASITEHAFLLHFVGPVNSTERAELEKLAELRGDTAWVQFHGEATRQQVIEYIHASDIFVLPSANDREGFPNVVLEAMACGRPIISSTVGAIPEMLNVESTQPCGLCVEPGDIEGLRQALRRLLAHAAMREEFGRRARTRVQTLYAMNVVFPQYITTWKSLRQPEEVESCASVS